MQQKYLCDFPDLIDELHPSRNHLVNIAKIPRGTAKKLWWKCNHGHEWEASVLCRTRSGGSGCPYCSGRAPTPDKCLSVKNPELAAQWHPSKNGDLSPSNIAASSGKKVWWLCGQGHEWEATIDHRNRGRGCPFCSGRKPSTQRNLELLFPEIASQWHPVKNGDLRPSDVLPKSTKTVWWLCPLGHDYQSPIVRRTSGNHGCNVCSGHVVNENNCLATMRPEISAEWHPIKNENLKPCDVTIGDSRSVWWQCSNFKNHEWKAIIGNRTGVKNSGCPLCRSSKGEKLIQSWLENKNIQYARQFRFDNCKDRRRLAFDFAVFPKDKPMRVIEFQGEQHYRPIDYWGGQEKFNELVRQDSIKMKYCQDNGIPLLVIPHWDKSKIEAILGNWLTE